MVGYIIEYYVTSVDPLGNIELWKTDAVHVINQLGGLDFLLLTLLACYSPSN